MSKRNVDLTWDKRTLIVHANGKTLRVGGEPVGDWPDISYVVYARYITVWDDGTPLSDEEQAKLLDEIAEEAARQGWKLEIERA